MDHDSCTLYRMVLFAMTLRDPNYPKPPHFLQFASLFMPT